MPGRGQDGCDHRALWVVQLRHNIAQALLALQPGHALMDTRFAATADVAQAFFVVYKHRPTNSQKTPAQRTCSHPSCSQYASSCPRSDRSQLAAPIYHRIMFRLNDRSSATRLGSVANALDPAGTESVRAAFGTGSLTYSGIAHPGAARRLPGRAAAL